MFLLTSVNIEMVNNTCHSQRIRLNKAADHVYKKRLSIYNNNITLQVSSNKSVTKVICKSKCFLVAIYIFGAVDNAVNT